MSLLNKLETSRSQTPIACRRDDDAFTVQEAARHGELLEQIQGSVQEVEELPDGYAFRFQSEAEQILTLAEFITLERRCCSFFTFRLEIQSGNGPLWLRLTGGQGVKEFLRDEMGALNP